MSEIRSSLYFKEIIMENEQKTAGRIKKRAEELFGQIREDRRYLHQIPEIGTDVPQTTAYICSRLDQMGISWQPCGGPLRRR